MSIHFPSEKKSSSSYIVDDASPPISTQQQDTKTPYADLNNSGDIASTSEPPLDAPPSYDAAPSISSHLQGHLAFNLNAPYFAFHVYRDSLFNHDLTIMTPDKSMVAYTMKTSSTSPMAKPPHVRVWRGPRELHASTSPVGTVTFNRDRSIAFSFHGRPPVIMQQELSRGFMLPIQRHGHMYQSPAPGVGCLVWNRGDTCSAFLHTVPGNLELARFETRQNSIDKKGVLRIAEGGLGDPWIDEVVTTAMTYNLYNRSRR